MAKKTAGEEAARYLEHRMRTVSDMRDHLIDKGYEKEETEAVITEMTSLRYLDDHEYAMSYFTYGYEKKRGASRIRRELEERGVDSETIDNAYEDYKYENGVDEYSVAVKIAERECRGAVIDERTLARVARKLEKLGYRGDNIYRVLGEMRTWTDTEEL